MLLLAELALDAARAEEQDFVLVLIVVGIDEISPPADRAIVRFALAFLADQRVPHVRSVSHAAVDRKTSARDGFSSYYPPSDRRDGL